jgi:hypothetical protein
MYRYVVCILFKVTKAIVERLLGCSELFPLVQSSESGTKVIKSSLSVSPFVGPLVQSNESGTIAWLLRVVSSRSK